MRMNTCRLCHGWGEDLIKYGTRDYAHVHCHLDRKGLSDLKPWQIANLPHRELTQRNLLESAIDICRKAGITE